MTDNIKTIFESKLEVVILKIIQLVKLSYTF